MAPYLVRMSVRLRLTDGSNYEKLLGNQDLKSGARACLLPFVASTGD